MAIYTVKVHCAQDRAAYLELTPKNPVDLSDPVIVWSKDDLADDLAEMLEFAPDQLVVTLHHPKGDQTLVQSRRQGRDFHEFIHLLTLEQEKLSLPWNRTSKQITFVDFVAGFLQLAPLKRGQHYRTLFVVQDPETSEYLAPLTRVQIGLTLDSLTSHGSQHEVHHRLLEWGRQTTLWMEPETSLDRRRLQPQIEVTPKQIRQLLAQTFTTGGLAIEINGLKRSYQVLPRTPLMTRTTPTQSVLLEFGPSETPYVTPKLEMYDFLDHLMRSSYQVPVQRKKTPSRWAQMKWTSKEGFAGFSGDLGGPFHQMALWEGGHSHLNLFSDSETPLQFQEKFQNRQQQTRRWIYEAKMSQLVRKWRRRRHRQRADSERLVQKKVIQWYRKLQTQRRIHAWAEAQTKQIIQRELRQVAQKRRREQEEKSQAGQKIGHFLLDCREVAQKKQLRKNCFQAWVQQFKSDRRERRDAHNQWWGQMAAVYPEIRTCYQIRAERQAREALEPARALLTRWRRWTEVQPLQRERKSILCRRFIQWHQGVKALKVQRQLDQQAQEELQRIAQQMAEMSRRLDEEKAENRQILQTHLSAWRKHTHVERADRQFKTFRYWAMHCEKQKRQQRLWVQKEMEKDTMRPHFNAWKHYWWNGSHAYDTEESSEEEYTDDWESDSENEIQNETQNEEMVTSEDDYAEDPAWERNDPVPAPQPYEEISYTDSSEDVAIVGVVLGAIFLFFFSLLAVMTVKLTSEWWTPDFLMNSTVSSISVLCHWILLLSGCIILAW